VTGLTKINFPKFTLTLYILPSTLGTKYHTKLQVQIIYSCVFYGHLKFFFFLVGCLTAIIIENMADDTHARTHKRHSTVGIRDHGLDFLLIQLSLFSCACHKTNSVACSLQANYTDRVTAACRRS
jgi:hypothetical protein